MYVPGEEEEGIKDEDEEKEGRIVSKQKGGKEKFNAYS